MKSPINRPAKASSLSEKQPTDVITASETVSGELSSAPPKNETPTETSNSERQQPIPPPSNPRQYRAIGLVEGQYLPSQEQLTRGVLVTSEGTVIDSVLLGRVISLVKNHLELDKPHLWVVYPRTRQENDALHVQIVGVWEPETLSQEQQAQDSDATLASQAIPQAQNGYFSIRGEVIFYSQEKETVVIKIRQSAKKESDQPKFFKLKLKGVLPDRPLNHFWDLQVQLQGDSLVIQEGSDCGALPKKRRPKFDRGDEGKRFPRRGDGSRPFPARESRDFQEKPSKPREGLSSKPIKRQPKDEQ
jgi:hypothetical protein